ncbi:MAG: gas vesicle protein [Anaerolineales bacterium]|nr:gas vesicle protein [Anaerolineales bacterium]
MQDEKKGERTHEGNGCGATSKKEIQALTGLDAETVSSIQHQGDGWVVTIDTIELHMTPIA